MHDAAADLSIDDHRVHAHAAILQGRIAQDRDMPGGWIDLDLRDMAGVGIGQRLGLPFDVGFKCRIDAGGEGIAGRTLQHARQFCQ